MTDPSLPLHHPVEVADLDAEPHEVSFAPGEQERAALAKALAIPGVAALTADVAFTRKGALVHARGHVSATLERTCVVSLDPMTEEIDEDFHVTFSEDADPEEGPEERLADLDAPEPIEGGVIDAGQVVTEQVVLAMSAHPRKEGAEAPTDPGAGARISPFDVLKDLSSGSKGDD